ncbi:MAG TPA: GNAT family N-acetyltransferase [Amnibacterium sp.]|nr:GNAT family N-acetyltransferase [Amnibacterium sp.]
MASALPALPAGMTLRAVGATEWPTVAWLWQAFRHDLADTVQGFPYPDGRYQARPLAAFPSSDTAGYLVWRPHPNTGEDAPVAFALIDGFQSGARTIVGFWVAPPLRRTGLGRWLAVEVLSRHAGPWEIGFQHENRPAAAFWRRVADAAFGPGGWAETTRPVPGLPKVPPDHVIRSTEAG